jgi:hypothetical protein
MFHHFIGCSGINLVSRLKKAMKENQRQPDQHLDTPAEANRDKHINFPEVEEESSQNFAIDKNSTNRQKQWQKGIEEGKQDRKDSNSIEK